MMLSPIFAGGADIAMFFIEMGAVILILAILGRFAGRIGFSPVPLYLVGGLILSGSGLVPDTGTTRDFVQLCAELGVILLLFMIGLEYSGSELTSALRTGLPSGIVDIVLNFTPGLVFGLLLGWGILPALLLGGVTYISSSGIIAKVLNDLNWLGNRETPAVLSILVMEDLVMAIYLPLMVVLLVGGGFVTGAISLTAALATVAVVFFLALRYGDKMSSFITGSDEVVLLTVFGLILLVGGIAQSLQVSSAVGAFLVGIAMSGSVAEHARKLLEPLRDLFAATFFVFFGLQIDPASLPPVIGLAILLGLITAITKVITGWIAAQRIGIAIKGRVRAGAGLIARGEFSIVIAGLGASAALTVPGADELIPLSAAYVLLMAVVGPILTRYADPLMTAILKYQDRRDMQRLEAQQSVGKPSPMPSDSTAD